MMLQFIAGSSASRSRRVAPPAATGLVVPTVNFTAGVASSHDLTQYVSGWNGSTMALLLQGTPLPSGITFNGTHLVYDGSGSTTSASGITLVVVML